MWGLVGRGFWVSREAKSPFFPAAATAEAETDEVHTATLGLGWKLGDGVKLGADYTYSYGDTGTYLYDGLAGTPSTSASSVALPDVQSTLHAFQLHGEYEFLPNLTLWRGCNYEYFALKDWAVGWSPIQAIADCQALLGGDASPNNTVPTVMARVTTRW